jgi:hypothetical protein
MVESGSVARRLSVIDDDPAFQITVGCSVRQFGRMLELAESESTDLPLLLQTPGDLSLTDPKMLGPP